MPNELELQKKVKAYLSDPSRVYETVSGKRLQTLSPGRINDFDGPDFLDVAILIGGSIAVGDAEFHRKTSDWIKHGHSDDPNYERVVLHIAFENDAELDKDIETLIIDPEKLRETETGEEETDFLENVYDLQDYALIRLLRKTAKARKFLSYGDVLDALRASAAAFLEKYNSMRRRPKYDAEDFKILLASLKGSKAEAFLRKLQNREKFDVFKEISALEKSEIATEGAGLRRELILNCALPLALRLADEDSRISLFHWYWSAPAASVYGAIRRRFGNLPQDYLWQQQGALEYMSSAGGNRSAVSEALKEYRLAEALDFYSVGRKPLDSY